MSDTIQKADALDGGRIYEVLSGDLQPEEMWDVLAGDMEPKGKRRLRDGLFALSVITAELAQIDKEALSDERFRHH
ncbi:MAG TPA: hypothetical protein VHL52_10050 [Acidimicrobiia bacterium]|nr:hypothetical protein [Acidimicrobiia bacterium]